VSAGPGLGLRRQRDVGALLGDAWRLYRGNFLTFWLIALAVIVPVDLIVSGLGLEQLFKGYDPTPPLEETGIEIGVSYLITAPLIAAMTTFAVMAADTGELRGAGRPITAGLEAFTPLFGAILLAAGGIALGLLAFVLPAFYLLIRWYFVPQAVVVDGRRGTEALARSAELVRSSWWRCLGVILLAAIASFLPAQLIQIPALAAADAADSAALALLGGMLARTLTAPFLAIVAVLLYFDLRARKEGPAAPAQAAAAPPAPGEAPSAQDLELPEAPAGAPKRDNDEQ
jgi:Membrane domain of glycerophosphoryl diester phosphodiesterase